MAHHPRCNGGEYIARVSRSAYKCCHIYSYVANRAGIVNLVKNGVTRKRCVAMAAEGDLEETSNKGVFKELRRSEKYALSMASLLRNASAPK